MTAAKFGDPVLGIDVHMVIIPAPPGTAPLPHPFIGVVFDPLGAALGAAMGAVFGGGGPVFVNGMPTGNTGTEAMNIPHFPTPPGTAPAPMDAPPDNEGTLLTGSKTVKFAGSSQSRELSSAISCSYPIDLPTSVVTPIPMGAPVNIGGPEAIDYAVAVTAGVKSGLKHAKKKWGKGASEWAHKKLGAPAGSKRSKFICFLTGHPVDVATGELIAEAVDFELGGSVLPITWERNYRSREGRHPTLPSLSSSLTERTPALGHAWFHPFETWLEEQAAGGIVTLAGPDGRPKTFNGLLRPGDSDWDPEDRETITRRARGYEVIKPNGVRWIYREELNPQNRLGVSQKRVFLLSAVMDAADNRVDLFYERGYLKWIVDAAGRVLDVRWNRLARMESIWFVGFVEHPFGELPAEHAAPTTLKQPLERAQLLVQYEYEIAQLSAARDARGHAISYKWSNGVLVEETHKAGMTFHFAWDFEHPDGNCVRTWGINPLFDPSPGASNSLPRILYDRRIRYVKEQRLTVVEDGGGGMTRYYTNGLGLVDKIADPLNVITEFTYSPGTWKLSEKDGLGNETTWEYDDKGRTTRETNALGLERRWKYNAAGDPIEYRDEARAITTTHYEHRRLPIVVTNPVGDITRATYDERGRPTTVTDPMGRSLAVAWTDRNDLVQIRVADRITVYEHDAFGRRLRSVDPLGRMEVLERDSVGNVTHAHRLNGEHLRFRYDEEGNIVEQVDSRGRTTKMRYGAISKLIEHTDAIGGRVRLQYDTDVELIGVENQHGDRYAFELDRAGRVKEERTFSGTKRKYVYDKAGRAIQVWSGARRLSKFERDKLGRVVHQTSQYPIPGVLTDPTEETFEYDIRGSLRRATTADTEVLFERDVLGRVVGEHETIKGTQLSTSIRNTYDRGGLRLQRTTSFAHRADYKYNSVGELTAVDAGWDLGGPFKALGVRQAVTPAFEIKIARDRLGQELARRLPGGVTSVWNRDPFGRPTEQRILTGATSQSPGRDVAKRLYAWSSPEEIASITTVGPAGHIESGSQYEYDPRGHLIRQLFNTGEVLERQSDLVGNLFKSPARDDRTYGPGGSIRRAGNTRYEIDLDGFVTKKVLPDGATWKYLWDAHGHLAEVSRPDGKTVTFTYDAFGRRTTKNFDGVTTEFVWDGDDLVHERRTVDATGESATVTTWVFEPGEFTPLAKIEGKKRFGIVSDHLGSPTMLATEAGEIAWRAQLDVYGVPREETAGVADEDRTENPWRFPGQYEDSETGLYYNRFRYYDPELGRYCSEDPIGLLGGAALYSYVKNSRRQGDPFGLSPWAWDPDDGMGHHLVPRKKAESMGWDHLASERHAPTFFPEPYTAGMHEELHRAQRPHLGPSQGPWKGTGDELLRAARKGLADFAPLGKLMIPSTKEVLAESVTATEAFDILKKWHKKQLKLKAALACGS